MVRHLVLVCIIIAHYYNSAMHSLLCHFLRLLTHSDPVFSIPTGLRIKLILPRPDLCDGRYEQFCHYAAPMYSNITSILLARSQFSLLETMLKYWLPNRGTPESFWHHEWNKHGTCVNTLAPRCYTSEDGEEEGEVKEYEEGQELVDYFQRAVTLFKQLDTFKALADADIHPSTSKTYTNREISDALYNLTGASVVLGCNRGALNQAWYTFNVRGNLQTGAFVASEPAGSGKGTCPEKGIHWWPKDN